MQSAIGSASTGETMWEWHCYSNACQSCWEYSYQYTLSKSWHLSQIPIIKIQIHYSGTSIIVDPHFSSIERLPHVVESSFGSLNCVLCTEVCMVLNNECTKERFHCMEPIVYHSPKLSECTSKAFTLNFENCNTHTVHNPTSCKCHMQMVLTLLILFTLLKLLD